MSERSFKLYQRKNHKGFGVPEALVALAILGISAVGLYEFMGGVEKVVYRTEQMGEMEGVLDQVSDSARKILTQTGTAAAPIDGICRVMTLSKDSIPVTSLSSGVMEIDLALFRSLPSGATNDPANIDAFAANPPKRPNDMWSMAFDSTKWTLQPNCWSDLGGDANQLGRYQRCYTPVPTAWPELGDATKLAAKEMRIQVALTPVKLNAVGTGLMQKSNNLEVVVPPKASEPLKKINARDHGFLITSKISWKSATKTEIRTHYNVVWAGEYTCLYGNKTSGGVNIPIYLNPSGIGSGTKSSTAVEIFSANHNIDEVKVEWLDTTYSVAKIENIAGSGNRAVTLSGSDGKNWGDNNDHRASFTAACQEQQFKCKKSTAARSWGPLITLNTLIRYRSSIAQDSRPALTFRRSTGGASFETLTPGTDLGTSVVYHVNTANPAQNYYNPTTNTLLLTRGLPSFGMQVNNAGGMCTRLCTNENKPEWQAYLNLGSGMDYKDDRNTGCVCCTMKQCAAIGNKSAACASQPIEPTDARVPECDSTDSVEIAKDINIISPVANQCVVARRNSSKTALEFLSRPCADSNPYLCYAAGRYFVPKSGANAINGPFANAAQNCYALGLQTVDLTELRDLLTEQGNISTAGRSPLPPTNFYDAGLTGIFLAPQSANMQNQAVAVLNDLFSNANEEVWIGFKTTAASRGVASAPIIDNAAHLPSAGWVAYYDDNRTTPKLRVVKDNDIVSSTGSAASGVLKKTSGNHYALVHSRRFSGALEIDGDQGTGGRALPALCFNPDQNKFFVSSATMTNVASAPEKCLLEHGLFVSPTKSLDWVQALSVVAPIHSMLPWPQPNGVLLTNETPQAASTQKAAWLALKYNGTTLVDYLNPASGNLDFYNILTGDTATATNSAMKLCKISALSYAVKNNCDSGETEVKKTGADSFANLVKDTYELNAVFKALRQEYHTASGSTWLGNLKGASPLLN